MMPPHVDALQLTIEVIPMGQSPVYPMLRIGALPLEMDVSKMNMGDVIDIYPYEGVVKNNATGTRGWALLVYEPVAPAGVSTRSRLVS